MSNRPKLKFSADRVQKLTQGYEERIQRQIEIINRLKDENMGLNAAARGAELIATGLLKRVGEPVVFTKAELETLDPTEVTVTEREDGGMLVRLEVKQ